MNRAFLNQPYPFVSSTKKHIVQATLFGFFIFTFLAIFQPFGLQNYHNPYKFILLGGYGIIALASMLSSHLLFTFLFPSWYQLKTWTINKHLLYSILIFIVIGVANWWYSTYMRFFRGSVSTFFLFQLMTLLVGIFPLTISTFIMYHKRLKQALDDAQSLNQSMLQTHNYKPEKQSIIIPSQNKSERFSLELDNLLYIKAIENYVEIGLIDKKIVLRNTLKTIESTLLDFPQIKRCHRSYLVNLQKIKSFSGNAQGLSLKFNLENAEEVPVSRSYVSEIKAAL